MELKSHDRLTHLRIKEPRVNDIEVERGIEKNTERTEEAFNNTGRDIRKRGRM